MDSNELFSYLDSGTIDWRPTHDALVIRQAILIESPAPLLILNPSTAYFVPASLFNLAPESTLTECAFVVWADEAPKPVSSRVVVAHCKDRSAWLQAFSTATEQLATLRQKEAALLDMAQLISQNVSLKRLCVEAAKILDHPTSILDNSLSFLAFSDDFPEYAAGRNEERNGMIPDAGIEAMKRQGLTALHGALKNTDQATSFDYQYEGKTFTNNIALIRNGATPIGSISCFSKHGPLRPSRLALLAHIAQLLSVELQKGSVYTLNKSMHYAQLFATFEQNGLALKRDVLKRRLELYGYRLKEYINVIYVDFSKDFLSTYQAESLVERVKPYIKNSFYNIEQAGIVFFTSTDNPTPIGECDVEGLTDALEDLFVKVGVSNTFSRPEFTSAYLNEAKRAIAVGNKIDPELKVYPFDSYRLFDLIDHIGDDKLLFSYRFPPLLRVIERDVRDNTHLAWTLYCYLEDPAHPAEVAKRLFIHKNTLYYRLDKIRDALGMDFKSATTIANIKLTFDVLRLQGRFDALVKRDPPPTEGARTHEA